MVLRLGIKKVGFKRGIARLARTRTILQRKQRAIVRAAAFKLKKAIVEGLRSGSPGGQKFTPLKPMTLLTRSIRSRRPLMETGQLSRAVSVRMDRSKNEAFIGIFRAARGSDGRSLFNVALAHENGTGPSTRKVTERMRKFFMAMSIKTGGKIKPISPGKGVINHPGIPARPFIKPAVDGSIVRIRKELQIKFNSLKL